MFLITVSAVNRATLCRLERNFSFIATVGAYDLMHLPGAAVEIRPSSITHIFHSFSFSYTWKIVTNDLRILSCQHQALLLNLWSVSRTYPFCSRRYHCIIRNGYHIARAVME